MSEFRFKTKLSSSNTCKWIKTSSLSFTAFDSKLRAKHKLDEDLKYTLQYSDKGDLVTVSDTDDLEEASKTTETLTIKTITAQPQDSINDNPTTNPNTNESNSNVTQTNQSNQIQLSR